MLKDLAFWEVLAAKRREGLESSNFGVRGVMFHATEPTIPRRYRLRQEYLVRNDVAGLGRAALRAEVLDCGIFCDTTGYVAPE
jgi:hypothetical protein